MEVILLEKIHKLGNLGDKVKVKSGYGRNYLIPAKKAVSATAEHVKEFEARRAELEKMQTDALGKAQARARGLADLAVTIPSRVGEEGRLFGSVGTAEIAEAVTAAGEELAKREVRLPDGPLREVGEYEIGVRLHADVDTTVKVHVVAEEDST